MTLPRFVLSTFILLLLFVVAHSQDSPTPFPGLDGWTMAVEETVYNPDNLWDLIDGAADVYLEYNFVDLHLCRYQQGDKEIRVELYKHATREDAFGIYAQE